MSLFALPEVIETEIFASLPDEFRVKDTPSIWGEINKGGEMLHSFIEGPSFDRDGNLYITDIPWGRIFRVTPEGDFTLVAEYDGEPNGLKIHKDGRIFITDYKNGIMQLDPVGGTVEPYCVRNRLERFKGVNDLVFNSKGDMFFTDQGLTGWHDPTGRVFRLSADGRLDCLVDTVPSPNGLVPNLDESIIYLAVTRANQVWRIPLQENGNTSKVGTFIYLSGGWGGPDGMALTAEGGPVVCHAGLGAVWVFDPLGQPLYRVNSCTGHGTTNVAFGGPDNKTMYITESETGTILKAELPIAGQVMYSHMD